MTRPPRGPIRVSAFLLRLNALPACLIRVEARIYITAAWYLSQNNTQKGSAIGSFATHQQANGNLRYVVIVLTIALGTLLRSLPRRRVMSGVVLCRGPRMMYPASR